MTVTATTAGGGSGARDTVADAYLVWSATLVAVMMTVARVWNRRGASVEPAGRDGSTGRRPLQTATETVQVTAVFDAPVTEAVNCWVAPVVTDSRGRSDCDGNDWRRLKIL